MEGLVEGDIVVVPFPFSNLTESKRRPALILAVLPGDDLILCQITSKARYDKYSVPLLAPDFRSGSLKLASFIRPNKLLTTDKAVVLYRIATITKEKLGEAVNQAIKILKGDA